MFEDRERVGRAGAARLRRGPWSRRVRGAAWTAELGARDGSGLSDAGRIELIGALEELANATRACQAVLTAQFDASQRAAQARAGVAPDQQGRGVAAQVALARRESPHRGQQHLGLARVLTREMPHTLAAFRPGGSVSGGRC